MYGQDFGLAWHDWGFDPRGWVGFCSTWDVTTYNMYAQAADPDLPAFPANPNYKKLNFDPKIGYDPAKGGVAPYPADVYLSFLATNESGRRINWSVIEDIAVVRSLLKPGSWGARGKAADAVFAVLEAYSPIL